MGSIHHHVCVFVFVGKERIFYRTHAMGGKQEWITHPCLQIVTNKHSIQKKYQYTGLGLAGGGPQGCSIFYSNRESKATTSNMV